MLGFGVFFISFFAIAFANDLPPCIKEAESLYRIIMDSVALENNLDEIDTPLLKLKELQSRKCFKMSDMKESYKQYFDATTGTVGDISERKRKKHWKDEKDYIHFLKNKGSEEQFILSKKKLISDINRIRPYGVTLENLEMTEISSSADRLKDCRTVNDIVPKLPPVKDQGSTGWCYFFVTADLLSFIKKTNISASYLGYIISPRGNGGSSAGVINDFVERYGLCKEETMPSDGLSKSSFDMIKDLNQMALEFKHNPNSCSFYEVLKHHFPSITALDLTDAIFSGIGKNDEVVDLKIYQHIAEYGTDLLKPNIIQHLILNQCKKDRDQLKSASDNVHLETLYQGMPGDYFKKIDQELSAGKPINMSYKFYNLTKGGGGGDHWSSIVGRRFINGECQYQVRNSWGASSCTKMVSNADACDPPGYFWAGAGDLYKSITGVQYAKEN